MLLSLISRNICQIELHEMLLKLGSTRYFSNWALRNAQVELYEIISQIELHVMILKLTPIVYLSNWAPRNASQVELHEVFLKLSCKGCC